MAKNKNIEEKSITKNKNNKTNKNTTISKNIIFCNNFWKKGTGLMFHKEKKDFAFIFPFKSPRKISITMWFVFFPIDIIFLKKNKEGKFYIIESIENLKPFTNYYSKEKSEAFIELPKRTINKFNINKNDLIEWNSEKIYLKKK